MGPKRSFKRQKLVIHQRVFNDNGTITKKKIPFCEPRASTDMLQASSDQSTLQSQGQKLNLPMQCSISAPEIPDPTPLPESSKKEKHVDAWRKIRPNLKTAFFESLVLLHDSCQSCLQPSETLVVCYSCDSRPALCPGCAVEVHEVDAKFHNMVQYKDGDRSSFNFRKELKFALHRDCGQTYVKALNVYDHEGVLHECDALYCNHMSEMESLVRFGYWPSSPRDPRYAIHMDLLQFIRVLVLETQSSLKSICQCLKWKNGISEVEVTTLYRILVNETFEEFHYFHYQIGHQPADGIDDGSSCPACPSDTGEVFISFDGNFGLVRKKNSGLSSEPPKRGDHYFIDQSKVDDFVNEYSTNAVIKDDRECSNFQATSAVRSKNKCANLDFSGVFGSACRHGVPKKFLSLRHGERYAYPALLLKTLVEGSTLHHHFIYDIACKFDRHIQRTMPELSNYDLALPVFHAYGHKMQCQVNYSTRSKEGYGLTDGECLERLWSYLRRFSHITKEMTPSHRVDLLSDALTHYAVGKVHHLSVSLCLSWQKAQDVQLRAKAALKQIYEEFAVNVESIRNWRDQEKLSISTKPVSKQHIDPWKRKYVKNLELRQQLCEDLALSEDQEQMAILSRHLREVQEMLVGIEQKHRISVRWTPDSPLYVNVMGDLQADKKESIVKKARSLAIEYSFLKEISRKYSDGQAIAQRVSKQIQRCSKSLRSVVSSYNALFPEDQITYQQVIDLSSSLYDQLGDPLTTADSVVPSSIKHRAIGSLNLLDRAIEEESLTQKDMLNMVAFYDCQVRLLQQRLSSLPRPLSKADEGVCYKLTELERNSSNIIVNCRNMFSSLSEECFNFELNELSDSDDDDDVME